MAMGQQERVLIGTREGLHELGTQHRSDLAGSEVTALATAAGHWWAIIDGQTIVHRVLAHPAVPGRVFAASAVGLVMSADGGESWRILTDGLHARYLRAVAVAGETVLVSASTGPGGRRAALYRTRADGQGEFERCCQGLPEWLGDNVDTHCLAARGRPWWSAPETAACTRPPTAGRASRS
jgi:hypothetical protein